MSGSPAPDQALATTSGTSIGRTAPPQPDSESDRPHSRRGSRGLQGEDVALPVDDPRHPFLGPDGFSLDTVLDIINPLQHIPIISTLYRRLTGDDISPAASLAGGALFGGILGFFAAVASEIVEQATGSDPGEQALALVFGNDPPNAAPRNGVPTAVAAAPAHQMPSAPVRQTQRTASLPAAPPPSDDTEASAADGAIEDLGAIEPAAGPDGVVPSILDTPARRAALFAGATAILPAAASAGPTAPVDLSGQMIRALDKYQALARSRATAGSSGAAPGAVPPVEFSQQY